MGTTTFSGPVRSERGFTAVGSTAVVEITAVTTLTYADHVGRIIEVNDADGAVTCHPLPVTPSVPHISSLSAQTPVI